MSGGDANVDSPNDEGKDVSAIINWVAQQRGTELDRAGVPRIGMVGESYGGGIQFTAAEQDCRIDAIAPTIAWHSLQTSLDKNDTPKAGWANILDSVAASAHLAPEIVASDQEMNSTGTIDQAAIDFFTSRGPAQFLSHIRIPTLILQGTVDDLFTLDEGIANYEALRAQGTPVSMAWFCGGHGVCLTDPGTAIDVSQLSLAWMQRYVAPAERRCPSCTASSLSTRAARRMRRRRIRFRPTARSPVPDPARSPSGPAGDRAPRRSSPTPRRPISSTPWPTP